MINPPTKNLITKLTSLALLVVFMFNMTSHLALAFDITATPDSGDVGVSASVGDITVTPSTGGGGAIGLPHTAVIFSGFAYPKATVFILKQGTLALSVKADDTGAFSATLEEKFDSTIVYTLYAIDLSSNKSLLINYPIVIYAGYITHLSGIRFAPTIVLDKVEVRSGDYLTVFGYALPSMDMEVFVDGPDKKSFTLTSNANGTYKIILPMQGLSKGNYVAYARYTSDGRITKLVKFIIGDTNIPNTDIVENIPGDCNYDGIINLVDFSVLAFWYGKDNPPTCVDTNRDGRIDLVDFSILAFWWTG